jgi:hypothetical protein
VRKWTWVFVWLVSIFCFNANASAEHLIKLVSNPGAGAEWTTTVPAGKFWRVLSVHYKLVNDATVATRISRLTFDDGTAAGIAYKGFNDIGQTASVTSDYSWAPGVGMPGVPAASTTCRTEAIPELVLSAGHRVRTITGNIQAADQYSEIVLLVDEGSAEAQILPVRGR